MAPTMRFTKKSLRKVAVQREKLAGAVGEPRRATARAKLWEARELGMRPFIRVIRAVLLSALLLSLIPDHSMSNAEALAGPPDGTDRYIVIFRPGVGNVRTAAAELRRQNNLAVTHVYDTVLDGFAARVPAQALAGLRRNPRVALIVPDEEIYAAATVIPTGVDRVGAEDIDGAGSSPGAGVPVAVLDTGIAKHPDLTIAGGYNCASNDANIDRDAWLDVDGHGTHVAGTIGASGGVNGVAPGTPLYAVKVLGDNGSGWWSWVICGLDWAVGQNIGVANLSLGAAGYGNESATDCASSALHQAICNAAKSGMRLVVAAGNDRMNTADFVPAKYSQVTTVSALADSDGCVGGLGPETGAGPDDTRARFSNYGSAVDAAAPGVAVYSTYPGGYTRLSGTSMAAPHVAALLALGDFAKEASRFGEPIATLPGGDTSCAGGSADPSGRAVVTRSDAYRVKEDRTLRRGAPGVLGNDSGSKPLTVTLVSRPRKGTLRLRPDGSFVYSPKRDENGSDSFTYRAKDALGKSDTATVRIRIVARPN